MICQFLEKANARKLTKPADPKKKAAVARRRRRYGGGRFERYPFGAQ